MIGPNPEDNVTYSYIQSVYWTLMTFTTVGYGDITASDTNGTLFSLFGMILGASLYSGAISWVLTLVQDVQISEDSFEHKTQCVLHFLRVSHLFIWKKN